MRCKKCGKFLGLIQKFCPKCGTVVTGQQKKKGLLVAALWLLLLILLVPVLFFLKKKFDPTSMAGSVKENWTTATYVALMVWANIFFLYIIIAWLVRLTMRRRILGTVIIVLLLVSIGTGAFYFYQYQSNESFAKSIIVLQDNLTEVAAAKIMGDAIISNKTIMGTSFDRVKAAGQMIANRLEFMNVPPELYDYRLAIMDWSKAIADSNKDAKSWKNISAQPRPFALKLSQSQADKFFKDSLDKITSLKEFGDGAIERKDKIAMIYIAAKLLVQNYWLNGLKNYSSSGSLSLNSIFMPQTAQASDFAVPKVGPSGPVPCQQVCAMIEKELDAAYRKKLWSMYGCSHCGKVSQPTQPEEQKKSDQTQNQVQTNKNSQQSDISNGASEQDQTKSGTANQAGDSGVNKPSIEMKRVCIGRGGIDTRTGGSPTNVYCVEDAIQSTQEIESSAIGFAQGNKNAGTSWDENWHNLDGAGITVGESTTNSAGHSHSVQAFYDACSTKGGVVGGAGTVKSGLPTTESGYTCEYKGKDSGGTAVPCWDFLTYSGGRYMGGNKGCEQKNLLPPISEKTIKDKTGGVAGRYDADYSHGASSINCSGDFSYSIPLPAGGGSIRNNILNTTMGPVPLSGNSVVYPISVTQSLGDGAYISINEIDTFRYTDTGFTGTYAATITATKDGMVKVASCYGAISGPRLK